GHDALTELGLAGENGDAAIAADADPGVEDRRLAEAAGQFRLRRHIRLGGLCKRAMRREREADDEGAAGRHEHAAGGGGEGGVHFCASLTGPCNSTVINLAARCTARKIRICVPQRQRLGAMAARIWASSGAAFFSSSACARIIMPGIQ